MTLRTLKAKAVALFLAVVLCMTSFTPTSVQAADTSYKTWKQTDDRWGDITMGTGGNTIRQVGCLVTSISMLMCHSGSVSASDFSPAVLVKHLNNNGGFTSSGALYWSKVNGCVSSFSLSNWKVSMSGLSRAEKIALMTDYIENGYSVVISVRYGNHWVALDRIEGEKVYMMDPGTNGSLLFDTYDEAGVDRLAIFKGAGKAGYVAGSVDTYGSAQTGKVNCSSLNMRSGAGTSYGAVASLSQGTSVKILGETKDSSGTKWYKISVNGLEGYVCAQYITVSASTASAGSSASQSDSSASVSGEKGKVKAAALNVRSGAGTDNAVVGTVHEGDIVTITSEKKDSSGTLWYGIQMTQSGSTLKGYSIADAIIKTSGGSTSSSSASTSSASSSSSATSSEKKGKVKASSLNVRSGAGTDCAVVGTVHEGDIVTITSEKKDASGTLWYGIKITKNGSTMKGYASAQYIEKTSGSASGTSSSGSTASSSSSSSSNTPAEVNVSSVYVRSGAGTTYDIVTSLTKGTEVTITGSKKDSEGTKWYKIKKGDMKGYVHSAYLTKKTSGSSSASSGEASSTQASSSSSSSTEVKTGTITGDWLNIRKKASVSAEIVCVLQKGTVVKILSSKKDDNGLKWYKINLTYAGTEYTGYGSSEWIKKNK